MAMTSIYQLALNRHFLEAVPPSSLPCLANSFGVRIKSSLGRMRSKCTLLFVPFVQVGARQPALRLAVHGVRGAGRRRARNQGSALRLVPADAPHRLPKGGSGALFRYWSYGTQYNHYIRIRIQVFYDFTLADEKIKIK